MLGKTEGRRSGQQKIQVGWHHNSMDMSLSKLWDIMKDKKPGMLQSSGLQRVGRDLVTEQQQILQQSAFHPRNARLL